MKSPSVNDLVGDTDIYLLDQVMKGRYQEGDRLLDAGCGTGRNLHWFLLNNIAIYGVDNDEVFIQDLKNKHSALANNFTVAAVEHMPFEDNFFDHIICSAVLHFAESTNHFDSMMAELVRVLRGGGSLFIRMTSDIGIEGSVELIAEGVYRIPDSSIRFLLTKDLLAFTMHKYSLSFLEPLKTVNVDDVRCMSTIMLQKN